MPSLAQVMFPLTELPIIQLEQQRRKAICRDCSERPEGCWKAIEYGCQKEYRAAERRATESGKCPIGNWDRMIEDLALVQVTYHPYRRLLSRSLAAIDRHWPKHPPIILTNNIDRQRVQLLEVLERVKEPFAVLLFSDYRICGKVDCDKLEACMRIMRNHPEVLSCSLTWEPVDKQPWNGFDRLPKHEPNWNYAANFQARIWNVDNLRQLLADLEADYPEKEIEHCLSDAFKRWDDLLAISYPIPEPPNPSGFVDENDKSQWIIPYVNIMHNGKVHHPREAKNVLIGLFTAPKFENRLLVCQRTWLNRAREFGQSYRIVCTGSGEPAADRLWLDVPDDLPHLAQQVREWCRAMLIDPDWDYLFKCDDDTYIDIERFIAFDPDDRDYIGGWCSFGGENYANGGAGYFLSRRAAEIVAEQLPEIGAEDYLVGKVLREAGIRVHWDNRFQGWANMVKRPSRYNDLITAHSKNPLVFAKCYEESGHDAKHLPENNEEREAEAKPLHSAMDFSAFQKAQSCPSLREFIAQSRR